MTQYTAYDILYIASDILSLYLFVIMQTFKKKILIDLDGVLNQYGAEKFDEAKIPAIKIGAKDFLKELSQDADLYLFTTRNLMLATKWLINNGIDKYFNDVTNIKIPSYLYIDDRNICFKGNFKDTLKEIREFRVYWKN